MVPKYLWIIATSWIIILDTTEIIVNCTMLTENTEDWMPISDPSKKLTSIQNVTVLFSYANNVFGPSIKIKSKKGLTNTTETIYAKGYALKTNLNRIKFDLYSVNHTVFQERGMKLMRPLQERSKRGVLHLYNMVSCATGCNPLIYKGYGCYCGFLGSGYAVDGIDRCCKKHDWCYNTAKCPMFLEYIVPYFWKCYYNRPLCAIHHGEFGGPGSCASRLCECDRVLSECLSRFRCPSSRALCRSSPLRLLQNALMIFS